MKKLMIAAAIVCAAVASQAASFGWTTGDCFMPYTIANIIVGDNQAAATSGATSKTIAGWASAGATFTATIALTYGSETVETKDFALAYNSKTIAVTGLENSLLELPADGKKEIAYSIVINGTYTTGGTTYTITSSEIVSGANPLVLTPLTSTPVKLATGVPASWSISTSAVPEPTSGLLLLLGMAGLALRRRRA